jgi:hypothetical protein
MKSGMMAISMRRGGNSENTKADTGDKNGEAE